MAWSVVRPKRKTHKRVAPERFRPRKTPPLKGPRVEHAGEKLALLACTGVILVLILSFGSGLRLEEFVGLGILVALALLCYARYVRIFSPDVVRSFRKQITACSVGVIMVLAARIASATAAIPLEVVPISLGTLVLVLVVGQRFAIETTMVIAPFVAFGFSLGEAREKVLYVTAMLLAGAILAGLSVSRVRRRSTLLRLGLLIGATHVVVLMGAFLLLGRELDRPFWDTTVLVAAHGVMIGFLLSGLLPFIEYAFNVTTDISLLELGNTQEHPLLKMLLVDAPGTFHHSYIVATLSEAAAEAIGANPLLARVGSLYHDIGKLNKPGYFAENSPDAKERHKELNPELSTLIISAHPRDGVEIGNYFDLPPQIIAFMPEHHGTTRIEYFYQMAVRRSGEDAVVESDFRYPGPKPQTPETAIVMIADSVQAISQQMPEPTPARLKEMIHEVAMKRLLDGQFDECGLTFRELRIIEEAFLQALVGIFHTRPAYPKGRPSPADMAQPRELRFPRAQDKQAAKRSGQPASAELPKQGAGNPTGRTP